MNVIEEERGAWFLLEKRDEYYLDVNSGRSFVGYSICFRLSTEEVSEYQLEGADYISTLARLVNDNQDQYFDRQQNLSREAQDSAHRAILAWNASKQT